MRILFLGNNWLGWKIAAWLRAQNEEIAGLILHPLQRQKHGDEIIACSGVDASRVFDGSQLARAESIEAIRQLKPQIGVSALFGYILRKELLDLLPEGCVNLHPALLPYNRGAFPNVWSIVDRTPAGTTIHYIDESVDTGDIISQREVAVEPLDTGESLYNKLEQASLDLFKETWPLIREGHAPRRAQLKSSGTYHTTRDVELIDHIDPDRTYTGREIIDILRARTFPPYHGAYFMHEGRRVYLRLHLEYEES